MENTMTLHSLSTLAFSLTALAFAVWMAVEHPAHGSVYAPFAKAHARAALASLRG
jgi:hypothetical protein